MYFLSKAGLHWGASAALPRFFLCVSAGIAKSLDKDFKDLKPGGADETWTSETGRLSGLFDTLSGGVDLVESIGHSNVGGFLDLWVPLTGLELTDSELRGVCTVPEALRPRCG